MSVFVNVPEFFSSVYLVDFSPSLCEVARQRFQRLGWKNVIVVCEDAAKFRLGNHENGLPGGYTPTLGDSYHNHTKNGCVDLVTMSYSLSMMVNIRKKRLKGNKLILIIHVHSPTTTPSLSR
jgi:betaine lipid synthase